MLCLHILKQITNLNQQKMTNLEKTFNFIKSLNLQEDSFYAITIYKDSATLQGHVTSNLLTTFNLLSKTGKFIHGNVEFLIEDFDKYQEYKFNIVLT